MRRGRFVSGNRGVVIARFMVTKENVMNLAIDLIGPMSYL